MALKPPTECPECGAKEIGVLSHNQDDVVVPIVNTGRTWFAQHERATIVCLKCNHRWMIHDIRDREEAVDNTPSTES